MFKVWVMIQLPNLDCKFIYGFLTLHWRHMPLGMGRGQNVGLRDFCNILSLLPPRASVFHMSSCSNSTFKNVLLYFIQKEFTLTVLDAEEPPLAIILGDITPIKENTQPQKVISAIQVDDPDADQSHVCQNVNSSTPFSVITNGNGEMNLVLTGGLDYESASSYTIVVRCSDGTFEKDKVLIYSVYFSLRKLLIF